MEGVQGNSRVTRSGRTASDVKGLYDLIETAREGEGDPSPRVGYLQADRKLTDEDALREAAESLRASDLTGHSQLLDCLTRISAQPVDRKAGGVAVGGAGSCGVFYA